MKRKERSAVSALPNEYNDNWGSNYMMDGFWYDMEYEKGLRSNPPANPIPQPSVRGLAKLPEGLIVAAEVPVVLEMGEEMEDLEALGLVSSGQEDIVDHFWFGDAEQDPERLPRSPKDLGLLQLQEAWGNRTDGIQRIDMVEREDRNSRVEDEREDEASRVRVARAFASARRRSARGFPLQRIREGLASQLTSKEASQAIPYWNDLVREHGLVGNVYMHASTFPGLHRGKWANEVKSVSQGCRFLIGEDNAVHRDFALTRGMTLLKSARQIPWSKAYQHYRGILEESGRLSKQASGDPRKLLQKAFLRTGKGPRLQIESSKPKHLMPSERVTQKEAQESFQKHTPNVVVVDKKDEFQQRQMAKLGKILDRLVRSSLLDRNEALELLQSGNTTHEILREAVAKVARVHQRKYSGGEPLPRKSNLSTRKAWGEVVSTPVSKDTAIQRRAFEEKVAQKTRWILKLIQGGMRGSRLAAVIREQLTHEEAMVANKTLSPVLKKTGALRDDRPSTKVYQDKKYTQHIASTHPVGVSDQEIQKGARWVRQQMTEGMSGSSLNQLVSIRLHPEVASSIKVKTARKKHEGVSGQIYVDAGAYLSKVGTTGCDQGALKHRANSIRSVLATSRCDGCVSNIDGHCQKYNKTLISQREAADLRKQFQAQALAVNEMNDQEVTASYFNPVDQFGLHNDNLDQLESHEASLVPSLEGIFFGGMEL